MTSDRNNLTFIKQLGLNMSKIVKDSRGLKEKLQELVSWEVSLLNRIYTTNVFTSLNHLFHQDNIDYHLIRNMTLGALKQWKKSRYSEYLSSTQLNPLTSYKYSIIGSINRVPDQFFQNNIENILINTGIVRKFDSKLFISPEIQAAITELESQIKIPNLIDQSDDFHTLMNLLNCLTNNDLAMHGFKIIKIIDSIKSEDERYYISEGLAYLDVFVLSSLGRSRIWCSMSKGAEKSSKIIPKLWRWTEYMKEIYPDYLDFQTHLSIQSKKHIVQTVKRHFQKNSNPEFISAVRGKRYQDVKMLLDAGANIDSIDPDDNNKTALHIACENADLTMIKLLESFGCDFQALDYEQMTPMFYAIFSENIEVIEYILSKGADLEHREFQDRTAFYCACCVCSPKIVDYLYKKGCNINAETRLKRTPLSKASYYGRVEVVKLLLSYPEIKVNHKDNKGKTALHNAVKGRTGGRAKRIYGASTQDSPEVARMLLEKGADVNARDLLGDTPLAVAASSYGEGSIPVLIEFGAEVNMQNNNGETPLFQASKYGHIETCQLLLDKYNANPFIKNNKGLDCLGVSIEYGRAELAEYYMKRFKARLDEDEDYFHQTVNLILKGPHQKLVINLLKSLFGNKTALTNSFFDKNTLSMLIDLRNRDIFDLVYTYLKIWKTSSSGKDFQATLVNILQKAISVSWSYPCKLLIPEYLEFLKEIKWNIHELPGLFFMDHEEFTYIILHLNIDIFEQDPSGATILHKLVNQKNTGLIVSLLDILQGKSHNVETLHNEFIKEQDSRGVLKLLEMKNEDGYTALEHAIIRKYCDIQNILTKFTGSNSNINIRLAKYKAEVFEGPNLNFHSKKEDLVKYIEILDDSIRTKRYNDQLLLNTKVQNEEVETISRVFGKFSVTQDSEKCTFFENLIAKRPLKYISQEHELAEMSNDLSSCSIIGVDLEHYSEERPEKVGFTCLMQISTVHRDYIVDCIRLHKVVAKYLKTVFLAEEIVKVFHGCDNDLKWLKSDFDIDVVNLYDTAKAIMLIENGKYVESLSSLTKKYLGFYMDKSYQQADWRVRPLPKGMIDYARMDSAVLVFLWAVLSKEMGLRQKFEMEKKMAKKCWRALEKSNIYRVSVLSLD